jgi:hypothetical protein
MSKYDIADLNKELDAALVNSQKYHSDMDRYLSYYLNSAFYASKTGQQRANTDISANLLRVFADKNIEFTSSFPTIKVPTTGATPEQRQAASLREKILNSTWRKSNGHLLQRKWAKDGTLLSIAVAETGFDLTNRCAFVKRYDPRYCFWQLSNGNEKRVTAFWAVVPITADEAFAKYGVRPTGNGGLSNTTLTNTFLKSIDGKDWFLQATRWDDQIRTSWIGDVPVEEPHQHLMGGIPIDVATPFDDLDTKGQGAFYLEPLVPLQANLNRTIDRRDNLVSRYAHPVGWGRGIMSKQLDDIKASFKNGGFVGLKSNGELGVVQIKEVGILNDHEKAIREDMLRLSGFSAAAMGELAGANTSGDALGMYFTPTQRHIEFQNIAWTAFYESVNTKILRITERFSKTGELFTVAGYSASGTLLPMADNPEKMQYQRGGFSETFDARQVIDGNYHSIVIFNPVTPKNELEEKRLVMDMMNQKVLSRTTGYEMIGIESPEDELALLTQEQSEPVLNPQGMQQLVAAATTANPPQPTAPPAPQPVAGEIKNVRQPVQ